MSLTPTQGEVWWAEAENKRRPVLVVTRSDAVPVLTWIIVAPVTRTVRQIPTEVSLGARHGLPDACVAAFDNLQPIRRSFLTIGPANSRSRNSTRSAEHCVRCRTAEEPRRKAVPDSAIQPGSCRCPQLHRERVTRRFVSCGGHLTGPWCVWTLG